MKDTCIYEIIPVDKKYSSLEEGYGCIIPGFSTITPMVRGTLKDKMKIFYLYVEIPDDIGFLTAGVYNAAGVEKSVLKTPDSYTIKENGDELQYRFELSDVKIPTYNLSPNNLELPPLIAYISAANEKNSIFERSDSITNIVPYGRPTVKILKNPYESDAAGNVKRGGDYRTIQIQANWFPINVSGAAKKIDKLTINGKIKKNSESEYKNVGISVKLVKTDKHASGWMSSTYDVTIPVNKSYTHEFIICASDGLSDEITTYLILQSEFRLFSWNRTGRGFAIGKSSEKNAFECNLDFIAMKSAEFKNGAAFKGEVTGVSNGVVIINVEIPTKPTIEPSSRFLDAQYIYEIPLSRNVNGQRLDESWLPELFPDAMCPEIYPLCALEDNPESGIYTKNEEKIYLKIYFYKEPSWEVNIKCKLTKSMSLEI